MKWRIISYKLIFLITGKIRKIFLYLKAFPGLHKSISISIDTVIILNSSFFYLFILIHFNRNRHLDKNIWAFLMRIENEFSFNFLGNWIRLLWKRVNKTTPKKKIYRNIIFEKCRTNAANVTTNNNNNNTLAYREFYSKKKRI